MRTSLNISNKLTMVSEMKGDSIFQILEYDDLKGSYNIESAIKLNEIKESGVRLKQVRISLHDSVVRIKRGVVSYLKGNIEITNRIGGAIELGKKLFSNKVIEESALKPLYKGTGEIFLEPIFSHYVLIELEDDEIIINDELFYACDGSVEVERIQQKSLQSMAVKDEVILLTKLSGSGIVVIEIPVPESEVFKCRINNDILKINGNFVILRNGDIEFTIEKSPKAIVSAYTSEESFVYVFKGTGEIWMIPTKIVYDKLKM